MLYFLFILYITFNALYFIFYYFIFISLYCVFKCIKGHTQLCKSHIYLKELYSSIAYFISLNKSITLDHVYKRRIQLYGYFRKQLTLLNALGGSELQHENTIHHPIFVVYVSCTHANLTIIYPSALQ